MTGANSILNLLTQFLKCPSIAIESKVFLKGNLLACTLSANNFLTIYSNHNTTEWNSLFSSILLNLFTYYWLNFVWPDWFLWWKIMVDDEKTYETNKSFNNTFFSFHFVLPTLSTIGALNQRLWIIIILRHLGLHLHVRTTCTLYKYTSVLLHVFTEIFTLILLLFSFFRCDKSSSVRSTDHNSFSF